MKKMTFEEFSKRTNEVAKARKIFIPHLTTNITHAFEMYQAVLADEEKQEKMAVFVSTMTAGNRPMTPLDDYVRPKCPECETDLMLRIGAVDQDGKQWETAWVCESCLAQFYSDKTMEGWMKELKRVSEQ